MARALETGTETVLAEIIDGVGLVTLNRPERRNALHTGMYTAVPAVLEQFIADPEVGCIVITGAGKAFCAGGDVRDGAKRRAAADNTDRRPPTVGERATDLARNAHMVELLHASPKLTIASLPGGAVGAGMSIALSTDFRIAGRSGTLVPGWGNLAFSGDFGGCWFLARLVGQARALELLVDGAPIDAQTGLRLGLFNKVVDDDALHTETMRWASTIAAGPREAWARMKANVQDSVEPLSVALLAESERMVRSGLTDEHRQAVKAWLQAAAEKKKGR